MMESALDIFTAFGQRKMEVGLQPLLVSHLSLVIL